MKFENTEVFNFEGALRGMRNPKESWDKSDSYYCMTKEFDCFECPAKKDCTMDVPTVGNGGYVIGVNDMKLAQTLIRAGSEHRKFLRQIFVSVDITAPLFWWKEFDTYKVGTVANSTSTMHKVTSKPITIESFEIDDYCPDVLTSTEEIDYHIQFLEGLRTKYLDLMKASKNEELSRDDRKIYEDKAKKVWKELIRWIPESWLQTRTVTMNYENLLNMCSKGQRRFHKLNEWSGIDDNTLENFVKWARTLPYAQEFIFIDEGID